MIKGRVYADAGGMSLRVAWLANIVVRVSEYVTLFGLWDVFDAY